MKCTKYARPHVPSELAVLMTDWSNVKLLLSLVTRNALSLNVGVDQDSSEMPTGTAFVGSNVAVSIIKVY